MRSLLLVVAMLLVFIFQLQAAGEYHNYDEMTKALRRIAAENPQRVKLQSQGTTLAKRKVWEVTLSSGKADEKPAVLVVGGVEGVDLATGEMCLAFIENIANNYGKTDSITQLLESTIFYIFPRVNPDAAEAFWNSPRYECRLNARPMDLDHDGAVDEDGYDDLNGDGMITMMRVTDPAGEWLADEKNPELLRKADRSKGEKGIYKVYSEGIDNDRDGAWNEDEAGGVDFNRNFTFNYKFFSKGAGFHQVSEIETRAVADFCFAHPNIAVVFSFSHNENLMHPWKAKKTPGVQGQRRFGRKPITSVLPKDAPYLDHLSQVFKKLTQFSDAPEPSKGEGAFSDWAYYHFGRWSVSAPVWWPPSVKEKNDSTKSNNSKTKTTSRVFRPGKKKKDTLADERRLLKWLQTSGQSAQFVKWQEIEHPDFAGKRVEVGGFAPYISINPPADRLASLKDKFSRFLLYLGSQCPSVKLEALRVENLDKDVYRITVHVTNEGYLPTNSQMGVKTQWARKVKAEIKLGGGQKLAGGRKMQLLDAIPGSGGSRELNWLVIGGKGSKVTVTVGSPMAGKDIQTIELK
ncbi:MAG: hypothetical protein GWP06_17330 [Actinobacteria bacterium]|nr:hypothetical protein [Actinomycetota bacterium]